MDSRYKFNENSETVWWMEFIIFAWYYYRNDVCVVVASLEMVRK